MTVSTYRAIATSLTWQNNRPLLLMGETSIGVRVHRVYRAFHFNNQTSAAAGVLTTMQVRRDTVTVATTGGTTITPVSHDTSNAALAATTFAMSGTGAIVGIVTSTVLRTYMFSNQGPTFTSGRFIEWLALVPAALIWDAGYGDTNVQPITIRPGFAFTLNHPLSDTGATNTSDLELEFTDEVA